MNGNCFVTTGIGLEDLVTNEIKQLGINQVKITQGGASFNASWEEALKALMWLRIPSRLLWELASFPATTADELYSCAKNFPWEEHLSDGATFAISISQHKTQVDHTQYAIHRLKDAIVDRVREKRGLRPSIDRENPDLALHLHIDRNQMTVSIDLSAGAMHQRGLRSGQHEAPIKENLAAAILYRANWPLLAEKGYNFIDPLCGSGTIILEAAMIAANIAPGLKRPHIGFAGWSKANMQTWERIKQEAENAVKTLKISFWGADIDGRAISWARDSLAILGVENNVSLVNLPLEKFLAKDIGGAAPALLATNPPYGRRLGAETDLTGLYKVLGNCLLKHTLWNGAVITEQETLGRAIGINASKSNHVYNGPNPCLILHFYAEDRQAAKTGNEHYQQPKPLSNGAQMVANRLTKNLKELKKWAKNEDVSCFRLYDADMPEYAAAIDLYEDQQAVVWEYAPPKSVDEEAANRRLQEILAALRQVTGLDKNHIHLKQRRHLKGGQARLQTPYNKEPEYFQIREGGAKLLVNFTDYLDTGIFLDHRLVRRQIAQLAAGKRFINLFCYTGSATVQAAINGAISSISVDTSATYLKWARKNLNLNLVDPAKHELIREDCLEWLENSSAVADVILVDVPTFSNSKSRETIFDVQRDHVTLLKKVLNHLAPGGTIIFSCNYRQFSFATAEITALGLKVEEMTERTIPFDFKRHPGIHRSWKLTDED